MMIISHIYISMGRLYCLEVMYYEWKGRGGEEGEGCVAKKEKRKKFKQPSPNKTKQTG